MKQCMGHRKNTYWPRMPKEDDISPPYPMVCRACRREKRIKVAVFLCVMAAIVTVVYLYL